MKFLDYITEATDNETINIIKKDCKHYLSIMKGISTPFYRGTYISSYNKITDILYKKNVRQDRRPKGMPVEEFASFNKWLEANHHNRRDNSISATSSEVVGMFGIPCYLFPIGDFNYTFIKAQDVNISAFEDYDCADILFSFPPRPSKRQNEILSRNIITNKEIKEAHAKEFEIWFNCKEYYLIPVSIENKPSWTKDKRTIYYPSGGRFTTIKVTLNPLKIVNEKSIDETL